MMACDVLKHPNKEDSPEVGQDKAPVEGNVVALAPEWYGMIGNWKDCGTS